MCLQLTAHPGYGRRSPIGRSLGERVRAVSTAAARSGMGCFRVSAFRLPDGRRGGPGCRRGLAAGRRWAGVRVRNCWRHGFAGQSSGGGFGIRTARGSGGCHTLTGGPEPVGTKVLQAGPTRDARRIRGDGLGLRDPGLRPDQPSLDARHRDVYAQSQDQCHAQEDAEQAQAAADPLKDLRAASGFVTRRAPRRLRIGSCTPRVGDPCAPLAGDRCAPTFTSCCAPAIRARCAASVRDR